MLVHWESCLLGSGNPATEAAHADSDNRDCAPGQPLRQPRTHCMSVALKTSILSNSFLRSLQISFAKLCKAFPYSLLQEGVSVVPNKPRMGTGRWELSVTRREQWLWPGHSLARSLARSPTGSITVFFTPCPYIRSCPSLPLCLLHSPSLSLVQSIPFRRFCALPS